MNIDGFALVTGAGSGIGRDCAIAYAIEGAAGVAFADLDPVAATAAAEESKLLATNPNYRALTIEVNVRDPDSVQEMVDTVVMAFGRIDYSVNSAGVGVEQPAEISKASVREFERFMDVNVKGTLLCVRAVSAQMKQQEARHFSLRKSTPARNCGRGVIINLGSSNSYVATPNIVQYTASKHAVMGITRNAALDLAPYGIRINSICPSWVETPMIERAVAGDPNLAFVMSRVVPMGRIATKEEVSDVLMFMSSPRASFVTGAGWMVDGGATLQLQT
ncbi:SDR family NAD(P)-dependent oxidoreductase [Aspergillus luchuensis]|uniref:Oxidoreductase, short-chain dehydrogenase/reductase family n=1 Tax=Aspergillus kawachii TaxID=1069201 RepID=A0A146FGV7_ASPKA|nr:putative secondary metabolism biosynthetic enzyme [Aspergillus luchuensis]BCS03322.1 putative secondary metabolism biosynthetic enzyme [Aspergillus luchuensis]GAT24541.1 oxidoreductase, short-chain dehydrogenase/reductase family [Aspergillus luchuensis]